MMNKIELTGEYHADVTMLMLEIGKLNSDNLSLRGSIRKLGRQKQGRDVIIKKLQGQAK
jgi:hypothetical protein